MLLLAALLLATPDVLDVDPTNGPYLQIRDAVDAANSGDLIRFAPGIYTHFGVFGKSLVIVPRSPGDVATIAGAVRVQSLGPGQRVVLAGLEVRTISSDASLTVAENQGAVRIEDSRFESTSWFGARVLSTTDVTFEACTILGGCGLGAGGCEGFAGVFAENSSMTLWGSQIRGATPTTYGYVGGAGIEASSCDIFVHGGELAGGNGSDERTSTFNPCQYEAQDGGDGIHAFQSSVRTRDVVFAPGSPGLTVNCGFFASSGEDVGLDGGSTLLQYPGDAVTLGLDRHWYPDQSVATVSSSGTPGDTVLLVIGPATGRVTLPGFTGDLHVGGPLGGARRVLLGPSPAQASLQLPDLAPFGILQWTLQSVHLRPGSEVVFGPTRAFHVIDAAW